MEASSDSTKPIIFHNQLTDILNEIKITHGIIRTASKQNKEATEELVNKLISSEPIDQVVLVLGEVIDYFLKNENFANAYFVLGLKSVSVIHHPYLDYSRVITLSYCGKQNDAKALLHRAMNNYPLDKSLKDLHEFLDTGLHVRHLYEPR